MGFPKNVNGGGLGPGQRGGGSDAGDHRQLSGYGGQCAQDRCGGEPQRDGGGDRLRPDADNPKSSVMTAWSVALLANLADPVQFF